MEDFLKQKQQLCNEAAHGDRAKAAQMVGVSRVSFYQWEKAQIRWPLVDERNYKALKAVIDERKN